VDGSEAGMQHYIMIGDQIKYEPGWVLNTDQKKNMKGMNVAGCTRALSGKHHCALLNQATNRLQQGQTD
jgi:hypothetical protein